MRNYEVMLVLFANLGEEETQNVIDGVTSSINENGEVTDR